MCDVTVKDGGALSSPLRTTVFPSFRRDPVLCRRIEGAAVVLCSSLFEFASSRRRALFQMGSVVGVFVSGVA
ncbi:hypothetical protein A2U01_0067286 [Trifolium medium]|uniref:Uncharacterized protein n=1 Tax=Trifolium medium TaxID=97028 RepID=A0A392SDW6_9FABA|nr:hypothetical protein [Trifolium medium]